LLGNNVKGKKNFIVIFFNVFLFMMWSSKFSKTPETVKLLKTKSQTDCLLLLNHTLTKSLPILDFILSLNHFWKPKEGEKSIEKTRNEKSRIRE